MSDLNNIRLRESAGRAEKMLTATKSGGEVIKGALFEAVAFVLLLAMFFYENGELYVKEQSVVEFFGNIAVMYVLSTLFDNNYRIKGKLVGYSSEKYVKAREEYCLAVNGIPDEKLDLLNSELTDFLESSVKNEMRTVLSKTGISIDRYEREYSSLTKRQLKDKGLSKRQIKSIAKARRVKPKKITLYDLLSDGTDKKESGVTGKSMRKMDVEHNVKGSLGYLFSALIFAYFTVELTMDFTLAAFGWYMLKVCFLVFRGIKSYFESFIEVSEGISGRLDSKRILLGFLLSKNSKNDC